jgi:hypothetical protein
MKSLRLLILAGLLSGLLPLNALANPGQACVFDPGLGMFVPEKGSGSCFGDLGFSIAIINEDEGFVLAGNGPDDNQWFRVNPNGKGAFHAKAEVPFLVYCSVETIAADACNPFSGQAFEGSGAVKVNTRLSPDGFFFDCPFTARITGTGTDAYGNSVHVTAALTLVPDEEEGCRATVSRVDAMPLVE